MTDRNLAATCSHSLPTKPIKTGLNTVIPKATQDTIWELHKKIKLQQLQLKAATNLIDELQEQQLKCFRCRQVNRSDDGSKS